MYAIPRRKTKWRSIGKERSTVIIFLFRMQIDFLRVTLSSYEANVTFLFHFGCIKADAGTCEPGLAVAVDARTSERERVQTMDYFNLPRLS